DVVGEQGAVQATRPRGVEAGGHEVPVLGERVPDELQTGRGGYLEAQDSLVARYHVAFNPHAAFTAPHVTREDGGISALTDEAVARDGHVYLRTFGRGPHHHGAVGERTRKDVVLDAKVDVARVRHADGCARARRRGRAVAPCKRQVIDPVLSFAQSEPGDGHAVARDDGVVGTARTREPKVAPPVGLLEKDSL